MMGEEEEFIEQEKEQEEKEEVVVVLERSQESLEMEAKKAVIMGHEVYLKVYSSPLLSHVEVSTNPSAFLDTLQRFHAAMGTRFMIPVIGGKDLDLHQLYVQVTQRGGLEKVILERKWRDVIASFNFPPTTTSASFVLRKYYLSLLFHYEQVYFFRTRGPLVAPSAILETKSPLGRLDPSEQSMRTKRPFPPRPFRGSHHRDQGEASSSAARPPAPEECFPAAPGARAAVSDGPAASGSGPLAPATTGETTPRTGTHNLTVSGTIDGKFEHGYFVSVNMGNRILHGVLYHVHSPTTPPHDDSSHSRPNRRRLSSNSSSAALVSTDADPGPSNAIVPYIPPTRSASRRRRYKYRDPAHPKPNRSAYNFFFAEKHSVLKALYPHREREYSKMIGELWSKLTEEERKVYDEYGRRDKERYKRELQEYRERMRVNAVQPREAQRVITMGVARPNDQMARDQVAGKGKEVYRGESSKAN